MNIVFISILLTTTYACIHLKHDDRILRVSLSHMEIYKPKVNKIR